MKRPKETPDEWMKKRYPSAEGRRKADEAIDKLDVDRPMHEFIDAWIRAYSEATKQG